MAGKKKIHNARKTFSGYLKNRPKFYKSKTFSKAKV